MVRDETRQLIALLMSFYGRETIKQETLRAYALVLDDIDVDTLTRAIKRIVATSKFFPSVSEIIAECRESKVETPSDGEAWGEVMAAVSRYGYARSPAFSHPAIASAVDQITWAAICESTNVEAIRAHFFRVYCACATRHKDRIAHKFLGANPGNDLIGNIVGALASGFRAPRDGEPWPKNELKSARGGEE